jgi:hypothetical protein
MSVSKRSAVKAVFGNIPVDTENLDWLYVRRHLATVPDGRWRELAYIVELDELEAVVLKTIDRIRKRDGAKIAREVADRLADSLAEMSRGPNLKLARSLPARRFGSGLGAPLKGDFCPMR